MTQTVARPVVEFTLGEFKFALNIDCVERVVRSVEITPLPDPPPGVLGVINFKGRIIPVFDLRPRLGLPVMELAASDHFVIAKTSRRHVALLVESSSGVVSGEGSTLTKPEDVLPHLDALEGVMTLHGEIVLVHDLDKFLSLEDDAALDAVLAR